MKKKFLSIIFLCIIFIFLCIAIFLTSPSIKNKYTDFSFNKINPKEKIIDMKTNENETVNFSQQAFIDADNVEYLTKIKNCNNPQYYIKNGKIVYKDEYSSKEEIILNMADLETFQIFYRESDDKTKKWGAGYARDKNQAYREDRIILGSDGYSFLVFKNIKFDALYAYDKNFVYFFAKRIENSDTNSFTPLTDFYAKDKNNVYYEGDIIPNLNSNTFEVLTYGYAKNIDYVYYKDKIVNSADSNTFQVLEHNYAKDNNSVYYLGEKIENCKPNKFTVLNDNYAKNDELVLYKGKILKNTEPLSFKISNDRNGEDNLNNYYGDLEISKDKNKELVNIDWYSQKKIFDFNFFDTEIAANKSIVYYIVGKVKDGQYKNWNLVNTELHFNDYGGIDIDIFYKFFVNPDDNKNYKYLWSNKNAYDYIYGNNEFNGSLIGEDKKSTFKDNIISNIEISGTSFPDTIIIDKGKGKVVFDDPSLILGYDKGDILYQHPDFGPIYENLSTNVAGGIYIELPDGSYISYQVNYDPYLKVNRGNITDGEILIDNNKDSNKSYYSGHIFHCENSISTVIIPNNIFDIAQLKKVGKTVKGDDLYGFNNINNDFLKYIVNSYHDNLNYSNRSSTKLEERLQDFIDTNSVIFWQDPLGRWIKITNRLKLEC